MADQVLLAFERATWSNTPLMKVADSALPKRFMDFSLPLVLFIPPVFCAVTAAMTGTGKCSLRKRQLECWERQGERMDIQRSAHG